MKTTRYRSSQVMLPNAAEADPVTGSDAQPKASAASNAMKIKGQRLMPNAAASVQRMPRVANLFLVSCG